MEMTRCIMRQAGAPPHFWAETLNNANYTRNRYPTSVLNGEIPFMAWTGKTPSVNYFQVFGTKTFVLDKTQNRGKFESKSQLGVFTGYAHESKAYRIYMPQSRSMTISKDVKFVNVIGFKNEYREILNEDEEYITVEVEKNATEEPREKPKNPELQGRQVLRRPGKRQATQSWENIVEPAKRDRRRPKLLRTGQVSRPRKV